MQPPCPPSEPNRWERPRELPTQTQGDRLRPPTLPPAPAAAPGAFQPLGEHARTPLPDPVPSARRALGEVPVELWVLALMVDRKQELEARISASPALEGPPETWEGGFQLQLGQMRKALRQLHDELKPEDVQFGDTDLRSWQDQLLRMMRRGVKISDLEAHFGWLAEGTGCEGGRAFIGCKPQGRVRLRLRSGIKCGAVAQLPAGAAVRLFLEDALAELEDPQRLVDLQTLDGSLQQKLRAVVYAAHLATAPEPEADVPQRRTLPFAEPPAPDRTLALPERTEAVRLALFGS